MRALSSSSTNSEIIPLDRICGLQPEVWLSVGTGFNREDVKTLVLSKGRGFIGDSIVSLQEICMKLTGVSNEQILAPSSRQEILRLLLSEPKIIAKMPELKRIRRQRNFLRRLDTAMQTGRLAFAHSQEEEVYHERLSQSLGENHLRQELRLLTHAYESWLEASSCTDLPLLIRKATQVLREDWPAEIDKPQEIWSLSIQIPESLEKEFWDVLGQHLQVKQIHDMNSLQNIESTFEWQKWHTLDDAATHLADQLALDSKTANWDHHAILIPDVPSVRRSLKRALEVKGLPLADPRDPTRLRWDEALKWALLPLEVVARNFERQSVVSWLRNFQMQVEFPGWVLEINTRGIRNSLSSYSGGMLAGVHTWLSELEASLNGRKTCQELGECHLKILRANIKTHSESNWLIAFFEQTWKTFVSDMERIGIAEKKAPLLFWLQRLETRLYEASPPVDRIKTLKGVKIYRLQQAPVEAVQKVWILGLPSLWFKGDGTGSYWFTEREREILSTEFSVRSSLQVHDERVNTLKSWLSGAARITVLDSQYDIDGRERESILPVLKELEIALGRNFPEIPTEMGSHARFAMSYGSIRPIQPQEVLLSPLPVGPGGASPEITATAVDRYSRCSFQALGFHRWNLRDIREPDTELWPDIRGNILHEAVRLLLKAMDSAGHFRVLPTEALDLAWKTKRPKGLIRSPRVESYVKSRMVWILEAFCEKEREYITRSGSRPVILEDESLRVEYPGVSIVGQPDRIDQHEQGIFILDYKTSGTVPHGSEMIERGYRLQLPFYAVASRRAFSQSVLGVQFVELDRRGSRKSGIFFKQFNGKEKGSLTQARSNSKSLVSLPPEETWDILEERLIQTAQSYVGGKFQALPNVSKREKECSRCSLSDLCGLRRLIEEETEEGAELV